MRGGSAVPSVIATGALIWTCACGRIGFDLTTNDAPVDTLPPFGAPVPLTVLNSINEDDDPTLPDDQLEIYFSTKRPGGSGGRDIWMSSRATRDDPWNPPVPVTALNTTVAEITPEIAADGLTLYFTRAVSGDDEIFVSTRLDRLSPWAVPTRVLELSAAGIADQSASPSPDLLTLVLGRGIPQNGARLYITTRVSPAVPWDPPIELADLDDPNAFESQAWLGETEIWYTVNGGTAQTIWMAPRTGQTSFGTPVPVSTLDLSGPESDPWLDSSLHTIYFENGNDLYMATR